MNINPQQLLPVDQIRHFIMMTIMLKMITLMKLIMAMVMMTTMMMMMMTMMMMIKGWCIYNSDRAAERNRTPRLLHCTAPSHADNSLTIILIIIIIIMMTMIKIYQLGHGDYYHDYYHD